MKIAHLARIVAGGVYGWRDTQDETRRPSRIRPKPIREQARQQRDDEEPERDTAKYGRHTEDVVSVDIRAPVRLLREVLG